MGTDISSIKDSTMIPEKISNVHTTEQTESFNHISQINNENKGIQDVKVEKKILLLNIVIITFFLLLFLLCSPSFALIYSLLIVIGIGVRNDRCHLYYLIK